MLVQFGERENQDLQVQITLLRPIMSSLLILSSGSRQHRTPQDCSRWWTEMFICSSFPCHFSNFCSFLVSLPVCLSYWILIQDPLSHSVLLCERCTSCFSSRTERVFQQFSTYDSVYALMYDAFIGFFWLLFAFWPSFLGMGSFIFNILFTSLLSMGPLLSPLRTF